MENRRPEIKYSDPVEEIMGNPPGKILRWGTFVIFGIFILFILFAWFLKYPDLIPAQVEITTENPPVTLVSRVNGPISQLYVKDTAHVKKGDVLAVMQSGASFSQFRILKNFTDTATHVMSLHNSYLPELSELAELQVYYSTFCKNISDYNNFITNDYYGNKLVSVKKDIIGTQFYIDRLKESEKLYTENLELDVNRWRRDSALHKADRTIPDSEYDRSKQALIRQKLDLQDIRLQLSAKNIEQTAKQQLLTEYAIKRAEELEKLSSSLQESFRNLRAQISMWERNYLLISPVNGTVSFTKYWSEHQAVMQDEPVLTIVPAVQGRYVGRVNLKMNRSGKVTVGREVYIKLSSYPYLEYGMVKGVVRSKSLVPAGDAYVIEIDLPQGLKTMYNRQLDFTQNMQGTAEIITDDLRLLQKIVNPFRYLLVKNKR
jgi:multidrug resistance efflux pump